MTNIGFLNVHSLRHKVADVEDLMERNSMSILALAETWLGSDITDGEVAIDGFSLLRKDRVGQQGGGVGIYIKNGVLYKPRPDLLTGSIEAIFVEIFAEPQPYIVASVYRPPNTGVSFWTELNDSLEKASHTTRDSEKPVLILGDLNVDVTSAAALRHDHHWSHLQDLCADFDLQILPTGPTHYVASGVSTTIDLALSSNQLIVQSSTALVECISDHLPLLISVCSSADNCTSSLRMGRNLSRIDYNQLQSDLVDQELDCFESSASVAANWGQWMDKVTAVLDRHAPLKQYRSRYKRKNAEWATDVFAQLIQKRNSLHRRWLDNPSDSQCHEQFRAVRADVKRMSRKLKAAYLTRVFKSNSSNPRATWKTLNSLTGRNRQHCAPAVTPVELAHQFQSVVTDVCRPAELEQPNGPDSQASLTDFAPTTPEDVQKLLSRVNINKATGSDGIPASFLHRCAHVLAPSLTFLINQSLCTGTVPQVLKRADVRPLFKGGDTTISKNYRPVSLLPIVSKLLEKVVQEQLRSHLERHHALPPCQFAYRNNHSTEDALVLAHDRFLEAKDNGMHTGLVLVDMSKAFDKVRHDVLIRDLHECGVGGVALRWFMSYLSDRSQRVVVPGQQPTEFTTCSCGVPQGSVLGPVLFSLYTRLVPTLMAEYGVQCQLFADDIMLYVSNREVSILNIRLSSAVTRLSTWLENRGLILNATKTQVMAMPAAGSHAKLSISCDNVPLTQTSESKYLGYVLDENLSGKSHVRSIRLKVAKKLGALWRARPFLSRSLALIYYKAVILPDILYASSSYYPLISTSTAVQLETLCKKSVRCIMEVSPWTHSAPLFSHLALKDFRQHIEKKFAVLLHRLVHKHASSLLSSRVSHVVRSDHIRTRAVENGNLCLPVPCRASGHKRPLYYGSNVWNMLSYEVKSEVDSKKFKHAVSDIFLS